MKVKTHAAPHDAQPEGTVNEAPAAPPAVDGEFTLSNGVTVRLAKPKGAVTLRIFEMLGPENARNEALLLSYKALMSITHLNGSAEATPLTKIAVEALAAQVGDDELFELIDLYFEHVAGKAQDVRPLS